MIAIETLLCLVQDFSSLCLRSGLSMPWEYHLACFTLFEKQELKQILLMAIDLAKQIVSIMNNAVSAQKLFIKTLHLITEILNWPFSNFASILGIGFFSSKDTILLSPDESWHSVFVESRDLLNFYTTVFFPFFILTLIVIQSCGRSFEIIQK